MSVCVILFGNSIWLNYFGLFWWKQNSNNSHSFCTVSHPHSSADCRLSSCALISRFCGRPAQDLDVQIAMRYGHFPHTIHIPGELWRAKFSLIGGPALNCIIKRGQRRLIGKWLLFPLFLRLENGFLGGGMEYDWPIAVPFLDSPQGSETKSNGRAFQLETMY